MNENNLLKEKFEISQKIIDFKNDIDVQKLQNLYLTKSYLEILSVNRREISHSSFLAWLLDRNENHLLQNFPINKFLEIILIRGASQIESYNSSFYNSIITDNYTIKTLNIKKNIKLIALVE
ncbi:PD-(D/E)XK nuclease family protein [Flavobacterium covae]|nr:PD-(D/E)XK nuclease family protein [Flavobacterium covae]QYS90475.1 PD-(D/E)XK nuclease family protein [Flavobacterium covae]